MGKKRNKSSTSPRLPLQPDHNPTPMVTGLPDQQQLLQQKENSSSQQDLLHYKIRKQKKVKLGRPPPQQKILKNVLKYNQVDSIKNSFMIYLDEIGYRQGLVFSAADRTKLQQQQQHGKKNLMPVEWDTQHKWVLQEEQQKITCIIQAQKIPEAYINQKLSNNLLDIADIFPREITGQIYKFLCQLFMIALKCNELSKENQDQLIREFVEKVCEEEGEFVFIVGRFSPKFRPLYDINKPMQKLCENIVKYTRQLIKN